MILGIYMLGSVVKYHILREINATLIITIDHSWIHHLTKQSHKYLSHLDHLTCCLTCIHVFCFCRGECHKYLLPVVQGNCCGPNNENST